MGVRGIFDKEAAELDLIVPRTQEGKLVVSDIKQDAMIQVDEKGTEAAAATGKLQQFAVIVFINTFWTFLWQ